MARWGGSVLLLLYLGAIFADFLAPYPEAKSFRNLTFASPTPIHWRTSAGRLTRPFVCATQRTRDPATFKLVLGEDCSKAHVINFFVQAEPYKLFGFVPTNLRLIGGDWLTSGQAHLFLWGADDFGRDLWGRVWYGARVSLTVGMFAAAVALVVGVVMGGLSGLYAGRPMTLSLGLFSPEFGVWWSQRSPIAALLRVLFWLALWVGLAWLTWITVAGYLRVTKGIEALIAGGIGLALLLSIGYFLVWKTVRLDLDTLIMRTTEVLAAIPDLFLLITLSVLIPTGLSAAVRFYLVICILSFVNWGGLARTVRSQVLQLREMEYAQAAKALGASEGRTLFRHILPGTFTFLVVTVTLAIPGFILAESGLSFLGLGIQEPATSWGLMLANAQAQGITAFIDRPWLLIPGLFIFVAILAYNFLGDGLRDALDPRARR
jgi:peptide/nickel transport system permease protein